MKNLLSNPIISGVLMSIITAAGAAIVRWLNLQALVKKVNAANDAIDDLKSTATSDITNGKSDIVKEKINTIINIGNGNKNGQKK